MAWQDVFSRPAEHVDAEQERELRLAAQAAAGAEWALAALVARYQPPVMRYLTRLTGNPELAQAEAEQIFVRMERRLHGPHGGANLRLWLLRAATEAGLNVLQEPRRRGKPQLAGPGQSIGLLPGQSAAQMGVAVEKLRAHLDTLATLTGTTARQMRKLVWSTPVEQNPTRGRSRASVKGDTKEEQAYGRAEAWGPGDDALDEQDPRVALRHRLVRAVLAELPYGDAQCLALHLVAGLNQREVARALGITASAVRRRVVQGLQLFARRYEAAIASLGLPPELTSEPDAEAPESDQIMVTGEVAAVSPPLPYPPHEAGAGVMPAEPSLPAAAATSAVETSDDVTTLATAPLPHEPGGEIVIDAEPIVAPVETAAEATSVTAGESERPFMVMPAAVTVDAPPVEEPRRVPVLTRLPRDDEQRIGASAERGHEDAIPSTRPALSGSAARVIPVLTASVKPPSQDTHAPVPDVETLEPLLADVALLDDPRVTVEAGPPADLHLASAALTGSGSLATVDSAVDV